MRVVPDDHVSLKGLEKWFEHLYEKFGWMLLHAAKHGSDSSKAKAYTESLERFSQHAGKYIEENGTSLAAHTIKDLKSWVQNIRFLHQKWIQNGSVLVGAGRKRASKRNLTKTRT